MESEYQILTGADASASMHQAITSGERGVQLVPDLDFALVTLGISYANVAEINLKRPKEFSDAVKKSREVLSRALKMNPEYPRRTSRWEDSRCCRAICRSREHICWKRCG